MARMSFITVSKWRALAQKRQAYLADLKSTGRWTRIYASEAAFEDALRAADEDLTKWTCVAHQLPASEAVE